MYRILITDEVSNKAIEILKSKKMQVDYQPGISKEELIKIIPNYDAILVRSRTKLFKDILEKASKLKVIGRVGVGLDNIDVDFAKSRGIKIVTAGEATADSVAELTICLMIALSRKVLIGDELLRRGIWGKSICFGTQLAGKTLGIIGVGRIGSRVARIASAMKMKVFGYDISMDRIKMLQEEGVNISYASLDDLLRNSDIISIHLPLLKSTRGFINKERVEKMKDGVLLINTARMELFDFDAVIWGLETGKIGGLAADTNLKPDHPFVRRLLGFPNVILTPHIGAQTKEGQDRAAIITATEVLKALGLS